MTVEENKKLANFAMKVDIKNDGRIHYTGIRANDVNGDLIFINEWSDYGEWE